MLCLLKAVELNLQLIGVNVVWPNGKGVTLRISKVKRHCLE